MLNKIYASFKKFIKNNYKILIIYVIVLSTIIIKTPYEINMPGSLIDMSDRIIVENEYRSKGSFNLTYVSAKKGNLLNYFLSFVIPSWDRVKIEDNKIENEDIKDVYKRYELSLKQGVSNSTYVAYKYAGKSVDIKEHNLTIMYVYNECKCDLKTGDIILKTNNNDTPTFKEFSNILYSSNNYVNLYIYRDNKNINVVCPLNNIDGKNYVGILVGDILELETNPKITYKYKKGEYGSSGGLLNTLIIYNKLTEKDITKGKVIAGTGTIDMEGNVGQIDGIKYKLIGADKKKADIFLVPTGNYEEALKVKKKYNLNITLYEAKTFQDVLEYLSNI